MYLLLFLPWPKHAAYTTHILQPLNTSLAAASFECWGLDCHFSWQRHPSLHLCCYLASQSTHLACCASNALLSWTTSAGSEPQNKAKPYCSHQAQVHRKRKISRGEKDTQSSCCHRCLAWDSTTEERRQGHLRFEKSFHIHLCFILGCSPLSAVQTEPSLKGSSFVTPQRRH